MTGRDGTGVAARLLFMVAIPAYRMLNDMTCGGGGVFFPGRWEG